MRVHITGMGLQGALLAHRLERYGVPFSWDDIDAPKTAWKASTGAIYPAGSFKFGDDWECFKVWDSWYQAGQFKNEHLERCSYVFGTKTPPHKGSYEHHPVGELRLASVPSYHFNAQKFVPYIRERFAKERLEVAPKLGDLTHHIIAHGFSPRLDRVYWGWTRLVTLDYIDRPEYGGQRPCYYFRPNKYQMAYAYPVPGTDYWYAGSSIIQQKPTAEAMKSLDMQTKYDRWKGMFLDFVKGEATIKAEATFIEGWRPAVANDDPTWVRKKGKTIITRPLWNNGIRHFPQQWTGIALLLGLEA